MMTTIVLVVILVNFLVKPYGGLSLIKPYTFPAELSVNSWQFVDSKALSIAPEVNNNLPKPNTEGEINHTNYIMSGQIYRYQKAAEMLTVQFYYVFSTFSEIKVYYQNLSSLLNLPKLINPVEKTNSQGYHFLFSDDKNRYLTACINPLGKSTVTVSQFAKYFYRPYFHPSQWFNLLTGKNIVRDRRCFWGQLSLPKTDASDKELETAWEAILSYWQGNFPKSKF